MDIRAKIRSVLREHYGNFETFLEHEYEDKVVSNLAEGNMKDKDAWATYNQVILELKHSIKDNLKTILIKELQYKLTDNIDPSKACIEVLDKVKNKTPELERLYYKVLNIR
jgi:hypothetical protein